MEAVQLKLKQASAVLGVKPKDIQNLVQFGVLKPKRRAGAFIFDTETLFVAQVAVYLKEAFGTRTELLSAYTAEFSSHLDDLLKTKPDFVLFISKFSREELSAELKLPFRKIAEKLEQRIEQLPLFRDLPRGRKRPGWKKAFFESLKEAAADLGEVSEKRILATVRQYRGERNQKPEITVVAEPQTAGT